MLSAPFSTISIVVVVVVTICMQWAWSVQLGMDRMVLIQFVSTLHVFISKTVSACFFLAIFLKELSILKIK